MEVKKLNNPKKKKIKKGETEEGKQKKIIRKETLKCYT